MAQTTTASTAARLVNRGRSGGGGRLGCAPGITQPRSSGERGRARVAGCLVEEFLDAHQLVVLGDPLATGWGAPT